DVQTAGGSRGNFLAGRFVVSTEAFGKRLERHVAARTPAQTAKALHDSQTILRRCRREAAPLHQRWHGSLQPAEEGQSRSRKRDPADAELPVSTVRHAGGPPAHVWPA